MMYREHVRRCVGCPWTVLFCFQQMKPQFIDQLGNTIRPPTAKSRKEGASIYSKLKRPPTTNSRKEGALIYRKRIRPPTANNLSN